MVAVRRARRSDGAGDADGGRAGSGAGRAFPAFDPTARNALHALGCALATLLSAAASLALARTVSCLAAGPGGDFVPWLAVALALSAASAAASTLLSARVPELDALERRGRAAERLVRDVLAMPERAYERHEKGYYLTLQSASAEAYGTLYVGLNVQLVGALLCMAAVACAAATLSPALVVPLAAYVPLFWLVSRAPVAWAGDLQRRGLPAQDAWLGEIRRVTGAKRAINAGRAEGAFSARFDRACAGFYRFQMRYQLASRLVGYLPELLSCLLQAAMLAVAVWECACGSADAGTVLAAYQLANLFKAPCATALSAWVGYRANRPHLDRLREVADAAREPSGFEGLYRR